MTPSQRQPRLAIAVIGAGAVGCHLGGLLSSSSAVRLVGRPRILDAIREHGLRLNGGGRRDREVTAPPLVLGTDASTAEGADVIVIATKSGGTRQAAFDVAPYVSARTTVVSSQNGVRNPDTLRAAFAEAIPDPAARPAVLGCVIAYNIAQTGPSTFHQGTSGPVFIEDLAEDHPARATFVPFLEACEAAGLAPVVTTDIVSMQYGKLVLNLNNAINALSGLPLREQLSDRTYRRCVALCHDEALAVMAAAGIHPGNATNMPASLIPSVLRSPDSVFRALAARALRMDPTARSSMADDFAMGRVTEVDEFQGAMVRLGEQQGIPTPVNRRVVELVREAERQPEAERRRWSGPDLLKDLVHAKDGDS